MGDRPLTRRGRARPVADAPVAALVADADELARDWLLALLAATPLDAVGRVPAGELAAQAPALCAAMARALADDEALETLAGDVVAARAGRLAGAEGPAEVAAALDMLRGVLWAAALNAVTRPDPALVAALADRLAAVTAAVTAAALAPEQQGRDAAAPAAAAAPPPPVAEPEPADVQARDLRPRIVDGDPLTALERCVDERRADARTFAVLLVELEGIDRLLAADLGGDVTDAVARAEAALEALLRPGDVARREQPGRVWLVVAGTGPAGARALALRVAAAIEREADHRGVALTASVGVSVFPVDGADPRTLAECAEDALFTARAAGTRGGSPPPPGLR